MFRKTKSKNESKAVASGRCKSVHYRTQSNKRASKQFENIDPQQTQQKPKEEKFISEKFANVFFYLIPQKE